MRRNQKPAPRGVLPARPRRGVLLLLILALLAMFGLVAVSFVVVTGHAMRSARAVQRIGQTTVDPESDLNKAVLQAIRGTNNQGSVLIEHSLLEDVYGGDWQVCDASLNATAIAGGQIIEISADAVTDPELHVGRVLTMLDGPAAGHSTRIIDYLPATTRFQILAFDGVKSSDVVADAEVRSFQINGPAFAGPGIGYDTSSGKLDATDALGLPLALLPGAMENHVPGIEANEDYDAVDFQNMLLAAQSAPTGTGKVQSTIPSLHRPSLVNYWWNRMATDMITCSGGAADWPSGTSDSVKYDMIRQPYGPDNLPNTGDEPLADPALANAIVELKRKILLRPLPEDHPYFNGSNANFNPRWDGDNPDGSAWDVDNDGDGQPDGIWVDLGQPVRSTADGRLYKPLFSILCLDLDGRLNLNAHGSLPQTLAAYYDPANVDPGNSDSYQLAGVGDAAGLPRGQGYGPAEVNLVRLFTAGDGTPDADALALYENLLSGDGLLEGRYGQGGKPGLPDYDDRLGRNRNFEFWQASAQTDGWNFWQFMVAGYKPNAYGSPTDFNGDGFLGLDPAGRPIYWMMAETKEQFDDPYELDLSPGRARGLAETARIDNPFSVAELERLLRPYDRDAGQLPRRLAVLSTDPADPLEPQLHKVRHQITTESWDVPGPNVPMERQLAVLLDAKGVDPSQWKQLVARELLAGLRMDLNRPLGDGIDNNGNGVVDEPGEGDQLTLNTTRVDATNAVAFSYSPDGDPTVTDSLIARQRLARDLYVLLMLVIDRDGLKSLPDLGLSSDADVARYLAQWAVNVVDFRDRDSIMTPFAFDLDPFTDGDSDGNPWDAPIGPPDSTWAHATLVWGCERPELLISETLAFHARRTEDLDTPDKKTTATAPDTPDEDFDQKLCPQGSLFVELFNPWTAMEPQPAELATGFNGGIDLTRTHNKAATGSPVWRLAVVEPGDDPLNTGETRDLNSPSVGDRPAIERSVYFVDLSGGAFDDPADGQVVHYPSNPATIAPVLPGRYTVIGPGDLAMPESITYVGQRTDQDVSLTRRIVLTPNANPNMADQVQVLFNRTLATNDLPTSDIQPPTAVVIDRAAPTVPDDPASPKLPRRLSISEPLTGYPAENPAGSAYDESAGVGYTQPFDQPLDVGKPMESYVMRDGTSDGVRIIHLQRLANPLLPFNADSNPYMTIDSAPVDLTAFNGVDSSQEWIDARVGIKIPAQDQKFHARQRGETEAALAADSMNLWKQEPTAKNIGGDDPDNAAALPLHVYQKPLVHSLGYLNAPFGAPQPGVPNNYTYKGDPPAPFAWLAWNNRPFVSQYELLLVPAMRSSKLLAANTTTPVKNYGVIKTGDVPEPYEPPGLVNVPYQHLLNFFRSGPTDDADSPQLHRLLEYVGVPSRFAGVELQGNPTVFSGASGHAFRPPFNLISRYREPGRINLNTIFSRDVYLGLMNDFPGLATNDGWNAFQESRRGYDSAVAAEYPTKYARPFRSSAGANLVPLANMEPPREIEATLLRSDDPTGSQRPLFGFDQNTPGLDAAELGDFNNPDRNPTFRYAGIQRLGNLVTTRSNVYAIWITVGYFEVEAAPSGYDTAVYPDGYRLMSELGMDTGEITRHRAFYIFDRSIPVGFHRGETMNVEDGLMVRRFIE